MAAELKTAPEIMTLANCGLEIVRSTASNADGLMHPFLQHEKESFDVAKLRDEAEQLERDLIKKEQETLNVLEQLQSIRMFVGDFKEKFVADSSSGSSSARSMLDELFQTKSSLNRSSLALSTIQASVESLNKKMKLDELHVDDNNKKLDEAEDLNAEPGQCKELMMVMNLESEQFKKMKEASRNEFIKAMREIEKTKNSIKMAEMRLNAAKKLEEAAKAVEAIVAAERSCSSPTPSDDLSEQPCEIAKLFRDKSVVRRTHEELTIVGKFSDEKPSIQADSDKVIYSHRRTTTTTHGDNGPRQKSESNPTKYKVKNSRSSRRNSVKKDRSSSTAFRSVISIGDILTRKLVLQDDDPNPTAKNHRHSSGDEQQHVSLSQMLKEQSQLIFHRSKPSPNGNIEKQVVVQGNKFGFISRSTFQ